MFPLKFRQQGRLYRQIYWYLMDDIEIGTWASICFKSLLENQLLEPPKLRWTVQMMLCVIFTFPSSSIFRCRIFRFQRIIHPTSNIHSLQRIQSYQSLIRSSCRRVGGLGPCLSRLRCPSRENIPAQLSMSGCQKTSRCTSLAARPPPPLPQSAKILSKTWLSGRMWLAYGAWRERMMARQLSPGTGTPLCPKTSLEKSCKSWTAAERWHHCPWKNSQCWVLGRVILKKKKG